MTCVSKEYEIETKMEEQWLQLEMLILLGYNNLKIVVQWGKLTFHGGNKNLVGEFYWWGIFLGRGGEWANFRLVEEELLGKC